MIEIQNITKIIQDELVLFDEKIHQILENDNVLLNEVIDFVFKKNGKRIRPILVFLAAKACGIPNNTTLSTAVALELLHTASLLHDDVVDESNERRSQPSVNNVFDNKVAILSGDYFLASSLSLATESKDLSILQLFTALGKDLSKGEIQQLYTSKKHVFSEELYFRIIRQKTAALFAVCSSSGALSVGASDFMVDLFYKLGECLGILFQIKDDIFDYFSDENIGKPTGNDIREGKVTLPLIYAINKTNSAEYQTIIQRIQNNQFTEDDIVSVVEFAKANGGIEYAEKVMNEYKSQALDLISKLDNKEIKLTFSEFVEYFMVRDK